MITNKCTGCMACYNICPYNAINIKQNEKGFYEPYIDMNKCKECNLCRKICPQNIDIEKNKNPLVYAAWNDEDKVRLESTSGGLFTMFAKLILKKSGVVYGACFDNDFKVIHRCVEKEEELKIFSGSKYVQSYIGDKYKEVKTFLDNGREVLFSGTACQIAGLKMFLRKDYSNLLTIDVLCHGVPSPKIFEDYKKSINKDNKKIKDIKFRYKKPSWTVFSMLIEYENGSKYIKDTYKDPYLRGFLEDYITNEACSECKYVGERRISDITLADFWGYISEENKYRNTEKGISLVLLNTEKGIKIFNNELINNGLKYISKDINEAKAGNQCLRKPFTKNKLYNEFWAEYENVGYEESSKKYFKPTKLKIKRKISLFFNDKAFLLPKKIRDKLIKIRTKYK